MKKMIKKTTIAFVTALFLTVSFMPMISANETSSQEQLIPIEIASIQENGLLKREIFQLTDIEVSSLMNKLNMLINLLNMAKGEDMVANILLDFINGDENPIVARIIEALLNSKMDFKRQLVVSAGWGLNLNPFKKSQTDFIKPFTLWHYAELSDALMLPSSTITLRMNPFEIKTLFGSQFGLMMRFRGVYIHIPQQLPSQSFTFFIGSAKHIMNFELPTLQLPEVLMNQ